MFGSFTNLQFFRRMLEKNALSINARSAKNRADRKCSERVCPKQRELFLWCSAVNALRTLVAFFFVR